MRPCSCSAQCYRHVSCESIVAACLCSRAFSEMLSFNYHHLNQMTSTSGKTIPNSLSLKTSDCIYVLSTCSKEWCSNKSLSAWHVYATSDFQGKLISRNVLLMALQLPKNTGGGRCDIESCILWLFRQCSVTLICMLCTKSVARFHFSSSTNVACH